MKASITIRVDSATLLWSLIRAVCVFSLRWIKLRNSKLLSFPQFSFKVTGAWWASKWSTIINIYLISLKHDNSQTSKCNFVANKLWVSTNKVNIYRIHGTLMDNFWGLDFCTFFAHYHESISHIKNGTNAFPWYVSLCELHFVNQ